MNVRKFTVLLAPSVVEALKVSPDYTVEAEYGDTCIEGKYLTLAHHGSRSCNPAPCNWAIDPQQPGTILISHIDLDTVGGILAITGDKIKDDKFWSGVEKIDVFGPHHMHELPACVQDEINAVLAWRDERRKLWNDEVSCVTEDVTGKIVEYAEFLEQILTLSEHRQPLIEAGRKWAADLEEAYEKKCVHESRFVRAFITDSLFCSCAYYSLKQNKIVPCTVTFNNVRGTITVAFADGGKEQGGEFSAKEIVQSLWGKDAGGRDGVAGSPRGKAMSEIDFRSCVERCEEIIRKEEVKQ